MYNITDVLLLSDIFGKFVKNIYKKYCYFSITFTDVHFEENKNKIWVFSWYWHVIHLWKKNRGETTREIENCIKTNNKYMNNFSSWKSSSFIIHLDFNNQYEHAFSEPVSYGEFEWVENKAMFSDNFIKKLQQK